MSTRVRKDGSFNRLSAQSVSQSQPAAIALTSITIATGTASAAANISTTGALQPGVYAINLALTGATGDYATLNYVVGLSSDNTSVKLTPATVATTVASVAGSTVFTLGMASNRLTITPGSTSTWPLQISGNAVKLA